MNHIDLDNLVFWTAAILVAFVTLVRAMSAC